MSRRRHRCVRLVLGAILAAATLGGCGSGSEREPESETHHDRPQVTATAVDVGFAQDMAVHHDQAILMSQLALTRGARVVRGIALSILGTQSQEVGALRGWLRVWGEPVVSPSPMSWMNGSGHAHSDGTTAPMPGMGSPDEMLALTRKTGKAFDVSFLQLMIRHHFGGIEMARAALTGESSALVREAARQMIAEQVRDLGVLRAQLRARGAKELPR